MSGLIWDYITANHIPSLMSGITDKMNSIQSLPGVCIFTACNYTPAFFKKGKRSPTETMLKPNLFINCSKKWDKKDLIGEDINVIESFTCSMFGYSRGICINEARYLDFKSTKLLEFSDFYVSKICFGNFYCRYNVVWFFLLCPHSLDFSPIISTTIYLLF